MSDSPVPAVEIRDLDLAAGGRPLLEKASLKVAPGELVLLVGLSGSGKSLTMKLLLDLIDRESRDFEIRGDLLLFGEPAARAARRRAGIVFQDFGLFDEWSVRENVGFAAEHSRRPRGTETSSGPSIDGLLRELDLPPAARIGTLSGGMKQRCALARTLAFDPDLLFYDEPTSGLDPALSAQVAQLIRRTHDQHAKTSFVVTHDVESLAGIADRIFLLDPELRAFRELRKDEVAAALLRLRDTAPRAEHDVLDRPRRVAALRAAADFLDGTARVLVASLRTATALLPRWPRLGWGLRYLLYYLRLSTLSSALAYVAVCGFILGLIVTWFTFSFLPFKEFTEPLILDRIIGAIGYALYRIMVPGMVAMLVAARSGAAFAADVGNRVYSRQIDALQSFGVPPERYLFTGMTLAHLIGMPLLVAVNFVAARTASLLVFAAVHQDLSTFFWAEEFQRFLSGDGRVWLGTGWLLGKSLASALGVCAIAWFQGLRPKASGRDVAVAVTRTIIWATLFVLLVQMIAALLEFEPI